MADRLCQLIALPLFGDTSTDAAATADPEVICGEVCKQKGFVSSSMLKSTVFGFAHISITSSRCCRKYCIPEDALS